MEKTQHESPLLSAAIQRADVCSKWVFQIKQGEILTSKGLEITIEMRMTTGGRAFFFYTELEYITILNIFIQKNRNFAKFPLSCFKSMNPAKQRHD